MDVKSPTSGKPGRFGEHGKRAKPSLPRVSLPTCCESWGDMSIAPESTAPISVSPQEQIAALQEQLAKTQKLAALGELVSTTTHEFNNVLMTILNYARMGLRHKD